MQWGCLVKQLLMPPLALGLLLSLASMANAAEESRRLAFSGTLKAEVFADGPSWCAERAAIRVTAEDKGLFATEGFEALVRRIGSILLPKECPAASRASVIGVDKASGAVVWRGEAAASSDWALVATGPASSPAPAATAAPAPVALTSASSVPTSPIPPAAPAAPVREIGKDYAGLLLLMLRQNATLVQDHGTLSWWAAYRFQREFEQVRYQEFKLQPLLDRAKDDLASAMDRANPDHVTVLYRTQFEAYDFATQQFPITQKITSLSLQPTWCCVNSKLPNSITVDVDGLDAIAGIPMDRASAQSFAEGRTRYGSIDRSLVIGATLKLAPEGFTSNGWGGTTVKARLVSAVLYADREGTSVLSRVDERTLAGLFAEREARKAAAARAEQERQREQERQKMIAQRDQDIRTLASMPVGARLANLLHPGRIEYGARLDALRNARTDALLQGKPVAVSMLIQAGAGGRTAVDTKWPGKLQVTVPGGGPELQSDGWYVVRGLLDMPDRDNALAPATLEATAVHACGKAECADAADAAFIVDHKLAAAGLSNGAR